MTNVPKETAIHTDVESAATMEELPTKSAIGASQITQDSEDVDDADDAGRFAPKNKRRMYLLALVVLLIVVGAVAAIILTRPDRNDGSGTEQKNVEGLDGGADDGEADGASDDDKDETAPPLTAPTALPVPELPVAATPAPQQDFSIPLPPTPSPIVSTTAPNAAPIVPVTISPITIAPVPVTSAPTTNGLLELFIPLSGFASLSDAATPQYKAYQWIANNDRLQANLSDEKKIQRYLLAIIFYSASSHDTFIVRPEYVNLDVCDWLSTVTCNNAGKVTDINLARQVMPLDGTIGVEIGQLSWLQTLDLAENALKGSIPEEIYALTNLSGLYLHNNEMTGTISTSIENFNLLENLYLNHNQLTGTIPREFRSRDFIKPLRKLYLGSNKLTGPIPESLRLRELFLLDLSFNQLTGTIPEDFPKTAVNLRHLYLDHNLFSGQPPVGLSTTGNDRLIDLFLNDNQFTGSVPDAWNKGNVKLLTLRAQNNLFSQSLSNNICKLDVLNGGEMVELGVDCEICSCNNICVNC